MTFGAYGNAFFGRCLLNKMKFTACIAAHHNNQYRSKRVNGGCTHGERKREEHYSVMGNDGILFYDAHWVIFMFNFQCFGSSVERVSVAICRLLIASVYILAFFIITVHRINDEFCKNAKFLKCIDLIVP